jgi:Ser/Thr protein kinase RdoA (MazF antagonist)
VLATTYDDLELMRTVLGRLERNMTGVPVPVASGRNHNWRVETETGPLFFRRHRHSRPRERIELGLAAMTHAGAKGVPVAAPVAAPDGTVLFGEFGRFASVYPWVDALTYERGAITREQGARFGRIHGRLHLALADFEHGALMPATETYWDTERSLADLARVRSVTAETGDLGSLNRDEVLGGLDAQVRVLEAGTLPVPEAYRELPWQPIHGDVHEGNVMLHPDGSVAAVVDWDMVATGPRLYEVVRALDFTYAIDDEATLEGYLSGYADVAPYRADEVGPIIELWAASVMHNTWALRARFLEDDRRVDPFIAAHRQRVRQYSDPEYRAWLVGQFVAFAAG